MNYNIKFWLLKATDRAPMPYAGYRYGRRLFSRFGNPPEPSGKIRHALAIADAIRPWRDIAGASILEIGTGKRPNLPIIMWLLGAKRTVSVDAFPDLSPRHIASDIKWYRSARRQLAAGLLKAGGGGGGKKRV